MADESRTPTTTQAPGGASGPALPAAGQNRPRGFAGMDPARQREIASLGGRAAHAQGVAHQFTPEEAAAAGRKGGRARQRRGPASG